MTKPNVLTSRHPEIFDIQQVKGVIARKVKDGQRKGKVFCEFTFDIKEKLNIGREEVDEFPGGILHIL